MIFLELTDPIASVARLDTEAQSALVLGVVTNKSGQDNKISHENLNTLRVFSVCQSFLFMSVKKCEFLYNK